VVRWWVHREPIIIYNERIFEIKLESIFEMWDADSKIDRNCLDSESLNTSVLHAKYHKIYTNERLILRKYEIDLKELKLNKFEFLTQGHTAETQAAGWQLPPAGRILKAEANNYVDVDKEVINLSLKVGIQHEKIGLLESIIRSLNNRGFQIKNAVDYIKFTSGVN